jgi:hypothetical protein
MADNIMGWNKSYLSKLPYRQFSEWIYILCEMPLENIIPATPGLLFGWEGFENFRLESNVIDEATFLFYSLFLYGTLNWLKINIRYIFKELQVKVVLNFSF